MDQVDMPSGGVKDFRGTLTERLLKRVLCDVATRCWQFTGGRNGRYGAIGVGTSRTRQAHRVSYVLFVSPIPDGQEIHHTCDNTLCVNPAHLVAVTRRAHLAVSPRWVGHRTHCVNGHPLSEGNVVRAALKNRGIRQCRTCANDAHRAHYAANRDAILLRQSVAGAKKRRAEGKPIRNHRSE